MSLEGRINLRDDTISVYAEEVTVLDVTGPDAAEAPVVITVAEPRVTPRLVADLKGILAAHPGAAPVHLLLRRGGPTSVLFDLAPFRVAPDAALFGDVKSLLGPDSVTRS